MSPEDALARRRYYMITAVHLIATAGAIFGLVIAGRANNNWYATLLGGAIIISALYVIAVVPRAMARKWRTPPEL